MTNKIIKYRPIDQEITDLAGEYKNPPEAILEILTTLQEQHGILDQSTITDVGRAIKSPPAYAYGVASFYSMLNLKKGAGNIIRVCDGPVCWLSGAGDTRQAVENALLEHSD